MIFDRETCSSLNALRNLSEGENTTSTWRRNSATRKSLTKRIKDKDTLGLVESEVALFAFEGVELDSGTVVEFMQAKRLDIPAVVYRSDIRGGSGEEAIDEEKNRWNLMVGFYPRTKIVYLSAIVDYQEVYQKVNGDNATAHAVARAYSESIAQVLLNAMEEVMGLSPIIDKDSKIKLKRQCLKLWGIDLKSR